MLLIGQEAKTAAKLRAEVAPFTAGHDHALSRLQKNRFLCFLNGDFPLFFSPTEN